MDKLFDLAIIGGGINGCGAAADAAMRGLSVILIEKDDLASKTSSASSKLIHGGLRYLEYYDFALVKKALNERQLLLDLAPHLVNPLSFVIPYEPHLRPTWMLRTGLFLYDNLSSKNKLPKSKLIKPKNNKDYFSPLKADFDKGFLFYDCAADDSRLTIANALQAKNYGAEIRLHSEITNASVINEHWQLTIKNKSNNSELIQAKAIVNATGPWIESINQRLNIHNIYKMSLIKGSHILVPKLYEGEHAYLLQNKDKRIVFILPLHGFHMIGTTDVKLKESLNEVKISSEEIDYLLNLVNQYLKNPLEKKDVLHTFSGVRPLLSQLGESNPSALSRDYICHYEHNPAANVCIYGGKITTYRQAAKEAIDKLKAVFPGLKNSATSLAPLPGARLTNMSYKEYLSFANEKYSWLDDALKKRYFTSYGTMTETILKNCHKPSDLGQNFGHSLYQVEVDYLIKEEWAESSEDILWRRTKLGLDFPIDKIHALEEYIKTL